MTNPGILFAPRWPSPRVVQGGNVGVAGKGEKVCPACSGTGHDPDLGYQLMGGCENCSATGVVPNE